MRIVIVSPHLDDGVLSFGASAACLSRAGAEVECVTVLAGRPDSTASPSDWDRRCGFCSAGEAARARRREDQQAWRILGVKPHWLEFDGHEPDGLIAEELRRRIKKRSLVLVPGTPLVHPDHQRVRRLADSVDGAVLCEYVEQPYEAQAFGRKLVRGRLSPRGKGWVSLSVTPRDLVLKRRAIRTYTSQVRQFRPGLAERVLLWERLAGGERARLLASRG